MFYRYKVRDVVKVPPTAENLEEEMLKALREKYEGKVDKELGIVISVQSIDNVGLGKIAPGDPNIYYEVEFSFIAYKPVLQEVVYGIVTDIVEFGAFIHIGPIEGLVHISQVMEEFIEVDTGAKIIKAKESSKKLIVGDLVKARIVSISLGSSLANSKFGLTMRQPGLGALHWLERQEEGEKK